MSRQTDTLESSGAVTALQDGEVFEAYMFQNQFFPEGEFVVISEQLPWAPEGAGEGQAFTDFQTVMIQYTGARNQFAYLFPYQDAEVEQGQRYALSGDWSDIGEDGGGDGGAGLFDEDDDEGFQQEFTDSLINVAYRPVSGGNGA